MHADSRLQCRVERLAIFDLGGCGITGIFLRKLARREAGSSDNNFH